MNEMKNSPEHRYPENPPMPEMRYEDEISLIDLWLIVMRRKMLVITIFLFCTIAALAFALTQPLTFSFTTIVNVGSNENGQPFESLETIQAKLEEILIPNIRVMSLDKKKSSDEENMIKVSIPTNAVAIRLETNGEEDDYTKISSLHGSVIESLKQQYKEQIRSAKSRLEGKLQLLNKQLDELNMQFSLPVSGQVSIEMLMLMDRRTASISKLEQNKQAITAQLSNLKEPGSFLSTTRSIKPVGKGRKVIVIVAAVLGLFLGLFSAFFAEFLAKVKLREKVG